MNAVDLPLNQAPWKQYSVLVVDDEPGMLSFLQRALTPRCSVRASTAWRTSRSRRASARASWCSAHCASARVHQYGLPALNLGVAVQHLIGGDIAQHASHGLGCV